MRSICCNVWDSFRGKHPSVLLRIAIVEVNADSRSGAAAGRKRCREYYAIARRDSVSGSIELADIDRSAWERGWAAE